MKLEQSFTVSAPVETVWEALIDVERVAPCMPGAEVTEVVGDGSFKGAFVVKLGPTTASYAGTLKMDDVDADAHVATMSARGTDRRGQGGASATIVSRVAEDPDGGGTRVDVDTDFTITGKLARFGRGGMIQDVANRMLKEFAANLEEEVQAGTPAPAPAAVPDPGDSEHPATSVDPLAVATDPGAAAAAVPVGADAPPAPQAPPVAAAPRATRAPAKPVSGFSLVLGALLDRLRRLFGRRG
ncbi:carbon monoxide dehydrogenase [Conexibacter sp. W3-3-2]|uniref:SRPBCC family protein n=1 Tax=Conexibacter sp. W3-3-2 TaxID=2675227 RepID=UPI0012B9DEFC|nr:SRPBCC family protein [Conexibacter sp. W3-3-2]MTD46655.1 carbon monoxide dehydrogenase [Conexibacter sp. W3-3-2]